MKPNTSRRCLNSTNVGGSPNAVPGKSFVFLQFSNRDRPKVAGGPMTPENASTNKDRESLPDTRAGGGGRTRRNAKIKAGKGYTKPRKRNHSRDPTKDISRSRIGEILTNKRFVFGPSYASGSWECPTRATAPTNRHRRTRVRAIN